MKNTYLLSLLTALSLSFMLSGCGSSSSSDTDADNTSETDNDTDSNTDTGSDTDTTSGLNPANFVSGALTTDPVIVDCTLNDGTETTCYEITTVGAPAGQEVGPFCPKTTSSTDEDSGIWLDGSGTVYQADGAFILDLPNLYGTSYPGGTWKLYDDENNVNITDSLEACEAAAQPNVPEAYNNFCVECSLDYVNGGLSKTFLIPVTPQPADTTGAISGDVGVALNGIELAAPAPVEAILGNYTVAIFDDCGGHINPNEGYHYHAATGCTEVGATQDDGHSAMIGYALDGYGIYGSKDSSGNETEGLDECRGIEDETRGYHYHVANPGENMFLGCYHGKTVESDDEGAGGPPNGGGPGGPPQ